MIKKTNIKKTSSFVKAAVVIEMTSFSFIALIKLISIRPSNDGWIPSSAMHIVILFLFLIFHSAFVPFLYYTTQKNASTKESITLIAIISALFIILLVLEPHDWYKSPSSRLANPVNQQEEYERFVDLVSNCELKNFNIYTMGTRGIKYTETEELINEISVALSEILVESISPISSYEYSKELKITLYLPNADYNWFYATFYYSIGEDVSLLVIPSKYEGGGYFILKNDYLDKIFEILEKYKVD